MNKEIKKEFEDRAIKYLLGLVSQFGKPLEELTELQMCTMQEEIGKTARNIIYQTRKEVEKDIYTQGAKDMWKAVQSKSIPYNSGTDELRGYNLAQKEVDTKAQQFIDSLEKQNDTA